MHTDGGTWKTNPGKAGYGYVIYMYNKTTDTKYGDEIDSGAGFCGITTNNVAEYHALIHGMLRALELGVTKLHVKADNMMMVNQVNREWTAKQEHLKVLQFEARQIADSFDVYTIEHVPRKQN
jgi:ribonuclease HI